MKNSPYLDRPLYPLAVALPRLLEKVGGGADDGRPSRGAAPPPAGAIDPRSAHAEGAIVDPFVS
jgi:hypothetical protein